MNNQAKVIELVLFKTKVGVTQEQLIQAARATTPVLEQMNGYVRRNISVDEQGQWADIVYWTSKEAALEAADKFQNIKECQQYTNMIELDQMKMNHFDIV
jgi:hypothetical protein